MKYREDKKKTNTFHSLQDLNMVVTAFPPQNKMETQQQFVTPKVLEVMDAAWWAERRQGKLGKHTDEHRWTRRGMKQTIWQPLLPDVHWSPVLNELHNQNGPLGREKRPLKVIREQKRDDAFVQIFISCKQQQLFCRFQQDKSGWPCAS